MNWLRGLACIVVLGVLSCSSHGGTAIPSLQRVQLPAGVLARVGSEEVALTTVSRIAQAQRVSPSVARDRAARDALFAVGARAAFEGSSLLPVVERAAWARGLLESLKTDAVARGPATDAEVGALTALRWQELDRPETVRTTHAVARVEKPELDAKAKAIALQIREAVRGVSDPKEFIRLAEAVPHEGIDVRIESLPAVTSDGRTYSPDNPSESGQFDKDFARAVSALAVGQISELVKSAFGYHVILCEERLPGVRLPLEQRRALLTEEVDKGRAERAKQELLARLSAAAPILITRSVDDLTARVRVAE